MHAFSPHLHAAARIAAAALLGWAGNAIALDAAAALEAAAPETPFAEKPLRLNITTYRRTPGYDAISLIESRDPAHGVRVEMALGADQARKGFIADHGFVGFQLESNARLGIKKSGGVPGLYYRKGF